MSSRGAVRVVVIGAGFGGLGVVRELKQAGVDDVVVLERADDVGGVWRENTYPGAACDVPSPLYSWSWAPNPRWARHYSPQPDILAYLRDAADRAGLLEHVVTGADVVSCVLDDATATWRVTCADGRTFDGDLVVSAVGQLSNPVVPDLPGRDTFAGPAFHSAQWRHDVDLRGRRVAVVGTGASAIQFVPGIVDDVASLAVFQRSAPYVVPKPDSAYSPLVHAAFTRFPRLLELDRRGTFAITERLNGALGGEMRGSRALLRALELVWRTQLRRQVPDAGLRERLRPDYEIGCKRLLFSNDWYPALARRHVEVVTEAVAAVEPAGVRAADGTLHEADVLIWGTGFAATDFLAGIDVVGTDGRRLHEEWADGARAHLGLAAPGFPGLCLVFGPNTNLGGSSIIEMMEAQARWIARLATRVAAGGAVAVRDDVAAEYDAEMQRRLRASVWAGCDSWYRDGTEGRITTNWPGTVREYLDRTGDHAADERILVPARV